MKYSKGPWKSFYATDGNRAARYYVIKESHGDAVCEVYDLEDGKVKETAQLISAAPELYEFAQAVIDSLNGLHAISMPDLITMGKYAIYKADGNLKEIR